MSRHRPRRRATRPTPASSAPRRSAGAWGARARASTTSSARSAPCCACSASAASTRRAGRWPASAVDRWLAARSRRPRRRDRPAVRDGPARVRPRPAAAGPGRRVRRRRPRPRGGAPARARPARRRRGRGHPPRRRSAIERIDADRTARRELLDCSARRRGRGSARRSPSPTSRARSTRSPALVAAGIDLLRVEVPIGRELADRLQAPGSRTSRPGAPGDSRAARADQPIDATRRRPAASARSASSADSPTGSPPSAAATSGWPPSAPALGVPEGAVVAAFERVDLVEAGPDRRDRRRRRRRRTARSPTTPSPDRLHRRAGTLVAIGAGPLVVAPDLASGVPSDPATRSGRALALQLLGVALAQGRRHAPPTQDRRRRVSRLARRRADRPARASSPRSPSAGRCSRTPVRSIEPPRRPPDRMAAWPHLLAAALVGAGDTVFVMRRSGRAARPWPAETRAAATSRGRGGARPRSSLGRCTGVALRSRPRRWSPRRSRRSTGSPTSAGGRSPAIAPATVRRARSAATRSPSAPEAFDPFAALGSAR